MREITTVLFDLDDTLHDDTKAYRAAVGRVARDAAREHGVDPAVLEAAYVEEANAFWRELTDEDLARGILEAREAMWSAAFHAAGRADASGPALRAAERYGRYRAEEYVLWPDARTLLETLRARGISVGIVTNGFAATHHEKVDLLGLRPLIDHLFLADEVGMVKPNPEIFRHACRVHGSDPAHTAMVGDRYNRDVAGARDAGLYTVLVDVHAIPIPDGAPQPDATVSSIGEVLAVLPLKGGATVQGVAGGQP